MVRETRVSPKATLDPDLVTETHTEVCETAAKKEKPRLVVPEMWMVLTGGTRTKTEPLVRALVFHLVSQQNLLLASLQRCQ